MVGIDKQSSFSYVTGTQSTYATSTPSQIPLKRGFSGFQDELKQPPKQRQQASGRTAEDPRKAKWRAAYLASQEEEDRDDMDLFNKKGGAEKTRVESVMANDRTFLTLSGFKVFVVTAEILQSKHKMMRIDSKTQ
jgi:hypothetical protein